MPVAIGLGYPKDRQAFLRKVVDDPEGDKREILNALKVPGW